MTGRSNALRLPVRAPRGVVYLTGLQWTLWWILSRPRRSWTHGDLTLERLSQLTGSSRGRCWHALTRLRSLELVSWRAWPAMPTEPDRRPRRFSPGCRGRLLVWIPAASRAARRGALGAIRHGAIDSVSGTYGAYASARGASVAWLARHPQPGRLRIWPPLERPPTPRRRPPRVVYGRCPVGHAVRLGRRTWIEGPPWAPSIAARFVGRCRRCDAVVVDGFELELPPPPPRGPSPAELADPAVLERRRRLAAELLADPSTSVALRERIRRDYLEPPGPDSDRYRPPASVERAGDVVERLAPHILGPAGRGRGGEDEDPSGDPTRNGR